MAKYDNLSKQLKAVINRRAYQMASELHIQMLRPLLSRQIIAAGIVGQDAAAVWAAEELLASLNVLEMVRVVDEESGADK
jgi:hypothetical protein